MTRVSSATQPTEKAIVFGTHFAAIRSMHDELLNIRNVTQGLPRFGQPLPEAKPRWDLLPNIDWFWVKVGIKSGLVGVIAITLVKWIHPPGPSCTSAHGLDPDRTNTTIYPGWRHWRQGNFAKRVFRLLLVLSGCIIVLLRPLRFSPIILL